MAGMYASNQQVRDELIAHCKASGAVIEDSTPAMIYASSADPRRTITDLRNTLADTLFRERTAHDGDQEAFITVLDAIDRTITVKVRRGL
ncbi:hypothetical protein ACIBJI_35125 [Nocardia sp. NPDC050408]|uniref:hypothetical protein n=1 Tax=Nocardia sp. NPDC050408 TaxID=3364319 RepID=UPI0037A715A1